MSETKPRRDHEHSDWKPSYVLASAIILVVSVFILCAGAWWVFREFQYSAASRQIGTARESAPPPPHPQLQVAPAADWDRKIASERTLLNSYGWVDRPRGTVHIPIRRAMELFAERNGAETAKGAKR